MNSPAVGLVSLLAIPLIGFIGFVAARRLTAAAFKVPDRLPPFGEAPLASYERARFGARLAIALAGPAFVYALAAVLFTLGLLLTKEALFGGTTVNVAPSKPAMEAGMSDGDRVIAINEAPVSSWDELAEVIRSHPGQELDLTIDRGGREIHIRVTPGAKGTPGEGKIGILARPELLTPGAALRRGLTAPGRVTADILREIPSLRASTLASGPTMIRETVRAAETSSGDVLLLFGTLAIAALMPWLTLASLALFSVPSRPAPVSVEGSGASTGAEAGSARPWVRFAARLIDYLVLSALVSALVQAPAHDVLLHPFILFVMWVPIEAALLALVGFTPGKWLLKTSVREPSGARLTVGQALRRSARVWVWGLGSSLPAVSVVTLLLAKRRLTRERATYWDALGGHHVAHAPLSVTRTAMAVVFGISMALLSMAMIARGVQP